MIENNIKNDFNTCLMQCFD
ncbi:hypothetical protein CP03DC29_0532A, partial [Chlamydia psittaci 03DC29]